MTAAIRMLLEAIEASDPSARKALVAVLRRTRDAGHHGAAGARVLNATIRVVKRYENPEA